MKPRIPLSTLCLLVAVVALAIAVFLLTARHNAQLMALTARHNAQLAAQAERHNAQLAAQAARHNAQLIAPAVEARKVQHGGSGGVSQAAPEW